MHLFHRQPRSVERHRLARPTLACSILLASGPLAAATIGVGTSADPPSGTRCALRDAIQAANTDLPSGFCTAGSGADTIVFARFVDRIVLQSELLVSAAEDLTIDGREVRVTLERDPDAAPFRILRASAGAATLTLRNVHVRGGRVEAASSGGGGILAEGIVVLEDSVVSGNVAVGQNARGGGIRSHEEVYLVRSEVSGNTADDANALGAGISADSVYLDDSSILDNMLPQGGAGAGIYAADIVEASRSLIAGNQVDTAFGAAGGVFATGIALVNSTVSGNSAGRGAGLAGTLITLTSSTITDNLAADNVSGGLLLVSSEAIDAQAGANSSIIYGNLGNASGLGGDATISGQDNLIGPVAASVTVQPGYLTCDPGLLPLADNGGPTWTHALPEGSCAVDAGNNLHDLATDQRGRARVTGPQSDIGAFELDDDRLFADGFEA